MACYDYDYGFDDDFGVRVELLSLRTEGAR